MVELPAADLLSEVLLQVGIELDIVVPGDDPVRNGIVCGIRIDASYPDSGFDGPLHQRHEDCRIAGTLRGY